MDYPLIRSQARCPICAAPKPDRSLWCWPCHNAIEGGTEHHRDCAERLLFWLEEALRNREAR